MSGVQFSVPAENAKVPPDSEDRWKPSGDSVPRLLIMLNNELKHWFVPLLCPVGPQKAN